MAVGVRGLLLVRMERDDRSAAGTTFCPCSPPPPRQSRPCSKRIRARSAALPGPPLAAGPAPPRSPAAAASITAAGKGREGSGGADREPSGAAWFKKKNGEGSGGGGGERGGRENQKITPAPEGRAPAGRAKAPRASPFR